MSDTGGAHVRDTIFDEDELTISDLDEEQGPVQPLQRLGNHLCKRLRIKVVAGPVPEEADNDECEFDIRMTDVPTEVLTQNAEPDLIEMRVATFSKQLWQRVSRKRLYGSVLLAILLAFLVGVSSFGQIALHLFPTSAPIQQSSSASLSLGDRGDTPVLPINETNILTPGPNNSTIVMARPLPSYCSSGEMLGQGRQIGSFPVWVLGIDSTAQVHLAPTVVKTVKTWRGWAIPLHLHGKYTTLQNITLTVVNLNNTSYPLLQDRTTLSSRLFLDAQHPMSIGGVDAKLGIWDLSLYLPSAGCYAMIAAWGHGHWMITFSAGE